MLRCRILLELHLARIIFCKNILFGIGLYQTGLHEQVWPLALQVLLKTHLRKLRHDFLEMELLSIFKPPVSIFQKDQRSEVLEAKSLKRLLIKAQESTTIDSILLQNAQL